MMMENVHATSSDSPPKARLARVFVIGSSLTLRLHPHLKRMLHGVCTYSRKGDTNAAFVEALKDLDIPKGASAGDSGKVMDYLQHAGEVEAFDTDYVILSVGFHDIKHDSKTGRNQVELELYASHISDMLTWFKERGIELIWLRLGPLDELLHNARMKSYQRFEADLASYNDAAERLFVGHNVTVLDLPAFTRGLGSMSELLEDHIHFRDTVTAAQAAYITGYLSAMLQEQTPGNG